MYLDRSSISSRIHAIEDEWIRIRSKIKSKIYAHFLDPGWSRVSDPGLNFTENPSQISPIPVVTIVTVLRMAAIQGLT